MNDKWIINNYNELTRANSIVVFNFPPSNLSMPTSKVRQLRYNEDREVKITNTPLLSLEKSVSFS